MQRTLPDANPSVNLQPLQRKEREHLVAQRRALLAAQVA